MKTIPALAFAAIMVASIHNSGVICSCPHTHAGERENLIVMSKKEEDNEEENEDAN